ncbi:MAG TPA: Rrf2 family transcriptional regulator [Phycisphaerae bacterium]|nr:Rrf2 family transcriptional regulator [Phycisphaerae bacterium]
MLITQKCRYGLRAVLELAKRDGQGLVKTADIAKAQAIPPRFLEVILGELRQGGFVTSRRGASGGYTLARAVSDLTVGEVIYFLQGGLAGLHCVGSGGKDACPLDGRCAFVELWEETAQAVSSIYDRTTFADLVERDRQKRGDYVETYSI